MLCHTVMTSRLVDARSNAVAAIHLFGGTSDARALCAVLDQLQLDYSVSVATTPDASWQGYWRFGTCRPPR